MSKETLIIICLVQAYLLIGIIILAFESNIGREDILVYVAVVIIGLPTVVIGFVRSLGLGSYHLLDWQYVIWSNKPLPKKYVEKAGKKLNMLKNGVEIQEAFWWNEKIQRRMMIKYYTKKIQEHNKQ